MGEEQTTEAGDEGNPATYLERDYCTESFCILFQAYGSQYKRLMPPTRIKQTYDRYYLCESATSDTPGFYLCKFHFCPEEYLLHKLGSIATI